MKASLLRRRLGLEPSTSINSSLALQLGQEHRRRGLLVWALALLLAQHVAGGPAEAGLQRSYVLPTSQHASLEQPHRPSSARMGSSAQLDHAAMQRVPIRGVSRGGLAEGVAAGTAVVPASAARTAELRPSTQLSAGLQHARRLLQERAPGDTTIARRGNWYWWGDQLRSSWDVAGETCSIYGGTLAVLQSPNGTALAMPDGLDKQVTYWVGLFHVPCGCPGCWTWVDQTPFVSEAAVWAQGAPAPGDSNNCIFAQWNKTSQQWEWVASDCDAQHAVLCGLPRNGLIGMQQPFSCLEGETLSLGPVYLNTSLGPHGSSLNSTQYPQMCAALCRADTHCAAFTLTGNVCQLQQRASSDYAHIVPLNGSASVSCVRYGLDFVNMGRQVAATRVPPNPGDSREWKCLPDYQANLHVLELLHDVCDLGACAAACYNSSEPCTAFVHSSTHCSCYVGRSPLYGCDLALGPMDPASGYTLCMREDADWLRMGTLGDPSSITATVGSQQYTLHHEALSFEDASAVCAMQDPPGALASITSLHAALQIAKRLLLAQPPRVIEPDTGVEPSMYGVWVGLQDGAAQQLAAALAVVNATEGQDLSQTVFWEDSSPVNTTLLQMLWALNPAGQLMREPNGLSQERSCVFFSNETGLLRPGLAAAGSCTWKLPFVCQSATSSREVVYSPLPPPPSPTTQQRQQQQMLQAASIDPFAGMTALSVADGDVGFIPTAGEASSTVPPSSGIGSSSSGGSGASQLAVPGLPTILAMPDTGVMMWVQPATEPLISHDEAQEWCGLWNGSLATIYNQTAQLALTGDYTDIDRKYWINLAVNATTKQWAWGQPNSPATSAAYLAGFNGWCAGSPPRTSGADTCAQLHFSYDCLSTPTEDGWGWVPASCDDEASYMCTAAPRGTPGRYFCAENYELGGVVRHVQDFKGSTSQEAASYCADLCTNRTWCHAFTVVGSRCLLKTRNTTSFSEDIVASNVTLGCFKYGILWDTLGGIVAVQHGVGANLTTRYRCVEQQDILRTDLRAVKIRSCSVADCTAQCFAMRLCKMVVFDHTTCTCTLASSPLSGLDGSNSVRPNITTCIYDDDAAFLGIGLVRSAAYITPPLPGDNNNGGGGSNGWWDIPPGGIDPNSGDLGDINFNSTDSTNSSDPTTRSPSPAPLTPSPSLTPGSPGPTPAPGSSSPVPTSPVPATGSPSPPSPTPPSPSPIAPVPGTSSPQNDNPSGSLSGVSGSPAPAESSSSSSFGVAEMVGITAGFCGGVLLLLSLACVCIVRRRRRLNGANGTGGSKLTGGGGMPAEGRDATLASIRAAGLSADVQRLVSEWLEGRYISSSGCSDGDGVAALPVVSPSLTREIEGVVKRDQEGSGVLSPGALGALMALLTTMQCSGPGSSSSLHSSDTGGGAAVVDQGAGGQPTPAALYASSAGVSDAYSAPSSVEHCTATAVQAEVADVLPAMVTAAAATIVGPDAPFGSSGAAAAAAAAALQQSPSGPSAPRLVPRPGGFDAVGAGLAAAAAFEMGSAMTSKSGICSSYITLQRLLGAGSFGTVYEGVWRKQTVAVKIIPHSPSAAPRVKNEVELAMQFDHPNVVRSFFYETFDTRAMGHMEAATAHRDTQETWIVLEFCAEGSLASRLYAHSANHGGPHGSGADEVVVPRPLHERDPCIASLESILIMARGVAQGMAYMHSLAICHGDLKCENVLLGAPGGRGSVLDRVVPKVGDFGLSRAIGDISSHLSTATVGTVTHMPPELLLSGQLRPSCDVYSFGIMLWQLYTGAVPYAGMRYAEIVYKVAVCSMRPVFPPDAPPAYRQLAEECWQVEATQRPTFEQVVERLGQLLAHVEQLEAERLSMLCPTSISPSIGPDGAPGSDCSHDITLQSPWIAACPHTSNNGAPEVHSNPVFGRPGWGTDLESVSLPHSQGNAPMPGGAPGSPAASPMHPQISFMQQPQLQGSGASTGAVGVQGLASASSGFASPRAHPIVAWGTQAATPRATLSSMGSGSVLLMPAAAATAAAGTTSSTTTTPRQSGTSGTIAPRPSPFPSPRDAAAIHGTASVSSSSPGWRTKSASEDRPSPMHAGGAQSPLSGVGQPLASSPPLTAWYPQIAGAHTTSLARGQSLQLPQAAWSPLAQPSGSLPPQALPQLHSPMQSPLALPPMATSAVSMTSGRSAVPPQSPPTSARSSLSALPPQSPPASARSSLTALPQGEASHPAASAAGGMTPASSRRTTHSMSYGSGSTSSRHVSTLGGPEAHVRLRAMSSSQVKLGKHALAALGDERYSGTAVFESTLEGVPGTGQDAA